MGDGECVDRYAFVLMMRIMETRKNLVNNASEKEEPMKIFIGLLVSGSVLLSGMLPLMAQDGKALFSKKCVMCHGAGGKKVAGVKFTEEGIKKGKPPKMPAYDGKLTPEEIKAVNDYANSLK